MLYKNMHNQTLLITYYSQKGSKSITIYWLSLSCFLSKKKSFRKSSSFMKLHVLLSLEGILIWHFY